MDASFFFACVQHFNLKTSTCNNGHVVGNSIITTYVQYADITSNYGAATY